MNSIRKLLPHDFIVCCIVLSLCFAGGGCSSKDDKAQIEEQEALIKLLQEEAVKLEAENDRLRESLAEALEKRKLAELKTGNEEAKRPVDPNGLLKTILTGMVGENKAQTVSESPGEELERLKQKNDSLRKLLVKATEMLEEQTGSKLHAQENERLKQENADLTKALAQANAGLREQAFESDQDASIEIRKRVETHIEAVIAELGSRISPARKMELLESLTELSNEQDPYVIDVVGKALGDPDPEIGRAAILLLENYETAEILPVISQALQSRDEQTRLDALTPLAGINDLQVADVLAVALNDKSEDVRSAALEIADDHADDIQLSVLRDAVSSQHYDVKSEAVSLLEFRGDHSVVDIIMEGLLDSNVEFREEVNSALDFLIDREFENYETARTWWDENKDNYDEDLFVIEANDGSESNE